MNFVPADREQENTDRFRLTESLNMFLFSLVSVVPYREQNTLNLQECKSQDEDGTEGGHSSDWGVGVNMGEKTANSEKNTLNLKSLEEVSAENGWMSETENCFWCKLQESWRRVRNMELLRWLLPRWPPHKIKNLPTINPGTVLHGPQLITVQWRCITVLITQISAHKELFLQHDLANSRPPPLFFKNWKW